jgi:hypothetical protein
VLPQNKIKKIKKMKRIVRLTERDLTRIVKRVISEQKEYPDVSVLDYLIGKTFDSGSRVFKIEDISSPGGDELVLDCTQINYHGKEVGGSLGRVAPGHFNNVEITYVCGYNYLKLDGKKLDTQKLPLEIQKNYCLKAKKDKVINLDY